MHGWMDGWIKVPQGAFYESQALYIIQGMLTGLLNKYLQNIQLTFFFKLCIFNRASKGLSGKINFQPSLIRRKASEKVGVRQ